MANQWFKFYGGEYLSDPKMLALTPCERSCWLTLLCYASMDGGEGTIKYLTEAQLMAQSGLNVYKDEWKNTIGVLDHLQELGMLQQSNGTITLTNWKKRQETFLTNAERQARFRDKQKSNAEVTPQRNKSNARIEENRIEETSTYARDFEKFWKIYPRKEAKKKALAAWTKLKPDKKLFDEIMAGLQKCMKGEQWTKDGGRFVPHPTTWLNGERWQDEVVGSKPKSTKYGNISTTKVRE